MTDRVKGCYVAFEKDYREDDVECTLNAIQRIKGVLKVTASKVDHGDWTAEQRADMKWRERIYELIK
jgi:hypothetical protein